MELRNETTLAAIAADPEGSPHYLMFGVIVDITEPEKKSKESNYVTVLKVIDPSLNVKVNNKETELRFHKYISVYIYTETPETAPKIQYIGEIIRLRRFKFRITDKGDLLGIEQKFSNWIIYSGKQGNDIASICFKTNFPKNFKREINEYEDGRIKDLRDWAYEYFGKHSLKYIIWWNDLPKKEDAPEVLPHTYDKIDIILKTITVDVHNKLYHFMDAEGRNYELSIALTPGLVKDSIIKLRCVNIDVSIHKKETLRKIIVGEKSSCLLLPAHFRDAIYFELDPKKLKDRSYYLLDFNADSKKKGIITATKKVHNSAKVTNSAKLQKILAHEPESHENEKFVWEGKISGFTSLEPTQIIKKMVTKTQPIVSYKDNVKGKYQIIYNIIPSLVDESSKTPLDVYILTSEENYYIFDAWKLLPQTKSIEEWNAIKNDKIVKFTDKLEAIASKGLKVRLVLQLLKTEGKQFYYKVTDTMFVDF